MEKPLPLQIEKNQSHSQSTEEKLILHILYRMIPVQELIKNAPPDFNFIQCHFYILCTTGISECGFCFKRSTI